MDAPAGEVKYYLVILNHVKVSLLIWIILHRNARVQVFPPVTLYEKYNGKGVRSFLDTKKLEDWPEVRDWYLKKKKKSEQDADLLMAQIKEAGHGLLGIQRVQVEPEKVRRKKMGPVGICPVCGEAYPLRHGERCLNCQGDTPYTAVTSVK